MEIQINGKFISVKSLREASKIFCDYIRNIPSSQMKKYDGRVTLNKKSYARIAYNGRVWEYGKAWILPVEEHNKLKEINI